MENPVIAIQNAYIAHIIANFGTHPRYLGLELPNFLAMETENGVYVMARGGDVAISCLEKALEAFSKAHGVSVSLNGNSLEIASMAA